MVLIIDNCKAHPEIKGLTNIALEFLPPNTTSVLQPMDQGIIRSLKAHYRSSLVKKVIDCIDNNEPMPKINVLDAMQMATDAWKKVTDETIVNCFRKSGISEGSQEAAVSDADDPFNELNSLVGQLCQLSPESVGDVAGQEFLDFDQDASGRDDEVLSDGEILEMVRGIEDVTAEEEDEIIDLASDFEPPEPPSLRMVRDVVATMESFYLYANLDAPTCDKLKSNIGSIKRIVNFQSKQKQLTMTHFFGN